MISMPWGIYTVYTNTSERAIEKGIHMFDKISVSAPVIRLCLFLTININVRVVVNTITILFDFRRIQFSLQTVQIEAILPILILTDMVRVVIDKV